MRATLLVVLAACQAAHGHGDDAGQSGSGDAADATDAATNSDAPAGKVGMFIAQGQLGRTMVSCDDGNTWVGNHSWELDGNELMCNMVQPNMRCGSTMCSYETGSGGCQQFLCCDDTSDIAEELAFGNGVIVGAWGHGKPGAMRMSTDGISWSTEAVSRAFSVAFGNGRFVAAGNPYTAWSVDGVTWTAGGSTHAFTTTGSPVRAIGYGDYQGGGRFVAVSAGSGRDVLVSSDGGESWWHPTTLPDTCALMVGAQSGGIVGEHIGNDDVLLILDGNGTACTSTDGGVTWAVHATGITSVTSQVVWNGHAFAFWEANQMFTSSDGASWTATPMGTQTRIGPVAYSPHGGPNGTYVALSYIFASYERQHFMRSTDGLTWETLPDGAYVQSHAIFFLRFGYGDPSTVCPLH